MRRGFTLVELLVVVAVIVILIAILVPALSKAMDASTRAKCLSNTRTVAQSCLQYAAEHDAQLPPYRIGGQESWAYDMRTNGQGYKNAGIGLLVEKYLASGTKLGELVHCPSLDNLAGTDGHCMDVIRKDGEKVISVGGSWFADPVYGGSTVNNAGVGAANPTVGQPVAGDQGIRVIVGYNYRAPSWNRQNKGPWRTNKIGAGTIVYVDLLDKRFRGDRGKYTHDMGYNRSFGDGSGGFFADPSEVSAVEKIVTDNYTDDGTADGFSASDEAAFEFMKVDKR